MIELSRGKCFIHKNIRNKKSSLIQGQSFRLDTLSHYSFNDLCLHIHPIKLTDGYFQYYCIAERQDSPLSIRIYLNDFNLSNISFSETSSKITGMPE